MGINNTNLAATQGTLTAPTITQTINTQTVTSYTAVIADAASVVLMNSTSNNTFFIPTNASVAFPIGSALSVIQYGNGQTNIIASATSTTTIQCNGADSNVTNPIFRGKFSAATCLKVATDTWVVIGDVY